MRFHMSSWNLDTEPRDPRDPSCEFKVRPMGSRGGERVESGGAGNGADSVTGVRAGPGCMVMTPLTGLIGEPSASRVWPAPPGSKNARESR